MRIAAPELGPFPTTFARIGIGALALLPFLLRPRHRGTLRDCKGPLLILGLFGSALPFSLLCWATLHLEAGFTSLLNATTPICAALIGFWWLRIPLTRFQFLGLAVGLGGIAILTGDQLDFRRDGAGWPIMAVLGATSCYGFAGPLHPNQALPPLPPCGFGREPPLRLPHPSPSRATLPSPCPARSERPHQHPRSRSPLYRRRLHPLLRPAQA